MLPKSVIKRSFTIEISGHSSDLQQAPKKLGVTFKPRRTNKHVNTINTVNSSNTATTDIQVTVDTVTSTIANATHVTSNTSVVCDGLHLTMQVDDTDQAQLHGRLENYQGALKLKNASAMQPYRKGRRLNDGEQHIGTFRFDPKTVNAGYAFLRVNPAKLDARQSLLIQEFVSEILGKPWIEIVSEARISLIDVAVDVSGVYIKDIIAVPSAATQSGYFLTFYQEGQTRLYQQGSEYIGHNKSEKHAIVYDKADELDELIKVAENKEKTRIEVQSKPRNRKPFGPTSYTLETLPKYPNPMRILDVVKYPKQIEGDDLLKVATALAVYVGTTTVLQMLDKKARRRVKPLLRSSPCSWWQPTQHWSDFLMWLAQHPLFACCNLLTKPAYEEYFNSVK